MHEAKLEDTRRWVEGVVVGLDLCPFAAAPLRQGRVRCVATDARGMEDQLAAIVEEVQRLDEWPPAEVATTLLVIPHAGDFDDILSLVEAAESLLAALSLDDRFQLVSFHPDYCFEDAPEDDPANHTNRAPWPLVHVLRSEDVARAVEGHPDISAIPDANIARLRALGASAIRALWARP